MPKGQSSIRKSLTSRQDLPTTCRTLSVANDEPPRCKVRSRVHDVRWTSPSSESLKHPRTDNLERLVQDWAIPIIAELES